MKGYRTRIITQAPGAPIVVSDEPSHASRREACDEILRRAKSAGAWQLARVRRELGRIFESAGAIRESHWFTEPTTGESFGFDIMEIS
jgi:hypothetical protein